MHCQNRQVDVNFLLDDRSRNGLCSSDIFSRPGLQYCSTFTLLLALLEHRYVLHYDCFRTLFVGCLHLLGGRRGGKDDQLGNESYDVQEHGQP